MMQKLEYKTTLVVPKKPSKIGVVLFHQYKSRPLIFTRRFFYFIAIRNALLHKSKEHARKLFLFNIINIEN